MVALLLDIENLLQPSFVSEAYRTVERKKGRIQTAIAFGSHVHAARVYDLAQRLGMTIVTTRFGEKNAADRRLAEAAKALPFPEYTTIVVGSGDHVFMRWLRPLRERGQRLECISRSHQLCKDAGAGYDEVHALDVKRMNLPTACDLRIAATDCVPALEDRAVRLDEATTMMRSSRIISRHVPGWKFFARHPDVFKVNTSASSVELV